MSPKVHVSGGLLAPITRSPIGSLMQLSAYKTRPTKLLVVGASATLDCPAQDHRSPLPYWYPSPLSFFIFLIYCWRCGERPICRSTFYSPYLWTGLLFSAIYDRKFKVYSSVQLVVGKTLVVGPSVLSLSLSMGHCADNMATTAPIVVQKEASMHVRNLQLRIMQNLIWC